MKVEGTGRNALSDLYYYAGRRRNIHVLGFEEGGVGNAGCAADEDDVTTQFRSDKAGGGGEALKECFSQWCSDDGVGLRHFESKRRVRYD